MNILAVSIVPILVPSVLAHGANARPDWPSKREGRFDKRRHDFHSRNVVERYYDDFDTEYEDFTLEDLRHEMKQMKAKSAALETRMNQYEQLKESVDNIQLSLDRFAAKDIMRSPRRPAITEPIAFSFRLDPQATPHKPVNGTLVFTHGLVNDGNGYDKTTGIFTAPISGVYVFSLFIANHSDGVSIAAALMVDGKVASMAGADVVQTGSNVMGGNVAVMLLYKGQHVKVEAGSFKGAYSSFSGFLLYVV